VVRAGAEVQIRRSEPSGDDRVAGRYDRYCELVAADLVAAGV
jgi:hypothetical protein